MLREHEYRASRTSPVITCLPRYAITNYTFVEKNTARYTVCTIGGNILAGASTDVEYRVTSEANLTRRSAFVWIKGKARSRSRERRVARSVVRSVGWTYGRYGHSTGRQAGGRPARQPGGQAGRQASERASLLALSRRAALYALSGRGSSARGAWGESAAASHDRASHTASLSVASGRVVSRKLALRLFFLISFVFSFRICFFFF